MKTPVYLDYNATTPVAPEVADAIDPFLREHFGNPSSSHVYGRRAHEAVDRAREQVAALIGATPGEIVFTGCATEANNLAILGVARALRTAKRHVVTSAVEHPAVLQPCLRLREDGWERHDRRGRRARPRRSAGCRTCAARRHRARLDHACEQRGRHDPAGGRDRGARALARRGRAHRRGAGRGEDPGGRRRARRRSAYARGTQVLRDQGHRRALRARRERRSRRCSSAPSTSAA